MKWLPLLLVLLLLPQQSHAQNADECVGENVVGGGTDAENNQEAYDRAVAADQNGTVNGNQSGGQSCGWGVTPPQYLGGWVATNIVVDENNVGTAEREVFWYVTGTCEDNGLVTPPGASGATECESDDGDNDPSDENHCDGQEGLTFDRVFGFDQLAPELDCSGGCEVTRDSITSGSSFNIHSYSYTGQDCSGGGSIETTGDLPDGLEYEETTSTETTTTSAPTTNPDGSTTTTTTTTTTSTTQGTGGGGSGSGDPGEFAGCTDPNGCEDFVEILEDETAGNQSDFYTDLIDSEGDTVEGAYDTFEQNLSTNEFDGTSDGGFVNLINWIPEFNSCNDFHLAAGVVDLPITCSDTAPFRGLFEFMLWGMMILSIWKMVTGEEY